MQTAVPDQASDRELVTAFVTARSQRAFEALYARHAPRMYGLARRLLGPRAADADDVLQTAWIRAATRLGAFRWEAALSTWLCGIVVNCCREWAPRELASMDEAPAPSAIAFRPETPLDVERALAGLAGGYRAVLILHDVEGYTHAEIAALLQIDPGTSKSQLSRARRAMRARLAGAGREHVRERR
jgi:RNA polymerase sigma-70 factor (ECF subfamily)